MSATRLLILGAVKVFQPVHGYDVRRELTSWRAEEWGNVAYGSIYFHLKQLTRDGLLEEVGTSQVGNRPARTQYRLTAEGEGQYQGLLRELWWKPRHIDDPFLVALAFMPDLLPSGELAEALRHRIQMAHAEASAMGFAEKGPGADASPPHVIEFFRLSLARTQAEAGWAEALLARVESGTLAADLRRWHQKHKASARAIGTPGSAASLDP